MGFQICGWFESHCDQAGEIRGSSWAWSWEFQAWVGSSRQSGEREMQMDDGGWVLGRLQEAARGGPILYSCTWLWLNPGDMRGGPKRGRQNKGQWEGRVPAGSRGTLRVRGVLNRVSYKAYEWGEGQVAIGLRTERRYAERWRMAKARRCRRRACWAFWNHGPP